MPILKKKAPAPPPVAPNALTLVDSLRQIVGVDGFLSGTFVKTLPQREARAEKVRAADAALVDVVAQLKKRGIRHPFVKNYVLARTTPLSRARKSMLECPVAIASSTW